jgi:two-component system response regulator YesN
MFRLLIVDDEEVITDGLYEAFSDILTYELDVYKAYSGKEALEWMKRTRIDVIVTDISMPGLSGIELIEQVQVLWPKCRVVFLTGYEQFDYVYQAIQMDDVKYILKAEGYDKVVDTVKGIFDQLSHRTTANPHMSLSSQEQFAFSYMAQSGYLTSLLMEPGRYSLEHIHEEFGRLGFHFDAYVPVYLLIGTAVDFKLTSYAEKRRLSESIHVKWRENFKNRVRSHIVIDRFDQWVFFVQQDKTSETMIDHFVEYLEGTTESFQQDVLDDYGVTCHMIISTQSVSWENVSKQYETLRQQQRHIDQEFPVIVKEQLEQPQLDPLFKDHAIHLLTIALSTNKQSDYLTVFDNLVEKANRLSYQDSLEIYMSIAVLLYTYIKKQESTGQKGYPSLFKVDDFQNLSEGYRLLRQLSLRLFKQQTTAEADRTTKIITMICRYIEEHLHEDLSLVKLGEVFHFNPSYLSNFFKKEKGMNVSEFIDQCRLAKAKQLLDTENLRINEICQEVGYYSAHSFTRFFKKQTGISPKEYREKRLSVMDY